MRPRSRFLRPFYDVRAGVVLDGPKEQSPSFGWSWRTHEEWAMKRFILISGLVGLACGFGVAVTAGEHGASAHKVLVPSEFVWTEAKALPCGIQTAVLEGPLDKETPFTFRARIPDGCIIPPHWHSSAEHVAVLSGSFGLGFGTVFDKSALTTIPTGGMAIMQPKVQHFVLTQGETLIQVHGVGPWGITYVNAADDQRQRTQ